MNHAHHNRRHDHDFTRVSVYAPTGPPPAHTMFEVFICPACGGVDVFPRSNFDLTTPAFRTRFAHALERDDLHWITS